MSSRATLLVKSLVLAHDEETSSDDHISHNCHWLANSLGDAGSCPSGTFTRLLLTDGEFPPRTAIIASAAPRRKTLFASVSSDWSPSRKLAVFASIG